MTAALHSLTTAAAELPSVCLEVMLTSTSAPQRRARARTAPPDAGSACAWRLLPDDLARRVLDRVAPRAAQWRRGAVCRAWRQLLRDAPRRVVLVPSRPRAGDARTWLLQRARPAWEVALCFTAHAHGTEQVEQQLLQKAFDKDVRVALVARAQALMISAGASDQAVVDKVAAALRTEACSRASISAQTTSGSRG